MREIGKWSGFAAVTLCVLGRCWCAAYIAGRKNRVLVTAGPYSVVRNPLYLFSFFGVVGIGSLSGTVTLTALLAVLFAVYYREVSLREEAVLGATFGDRYAAYRTRVPAWLPRFRLWQDAPSMSVELKPFLCSIRDSAWFFAAIPAFEALWALQDAGALPILLRLP